MKIILDGVYTAALTNQAIDEGIISDCKRQIPSDYYEYSSRYKTRALEFLLLADAVKFTMTDSKINFEDLTKKGIISIHSYLTYTEDEWKERKQYLDDSKFIADLETYKPIILNHLYKSVKRKWPKYFRQHKVSLKTFISISIDKLSGKNINEEYLKKCGFALWDMQPEGLKMYSWQHLVKEYWVDYVFPVSRYIIELLNFSFNNDFGLSSTLFDKRLVTDMNNLEKIETYSHQQSYSILMYSLKDVLGYLPRINSIEEALIIKEKKHKQIQALKQTIDEIRISFKEGNIPAVKRAATLVKKANNDLKKNQILSKINDWTTYIALPVGVAETISGIIPVLGLSMGAISIVNTGLNKKLNNQNWMSIYRG